MSRLFILRKRLGSLVIVLLCCAVCFACPIKVCADGENATAQQNKIGLTEEDENSLYSNFIELGINSEVAEYLVQKYKSTGLIDAIDERKEPEYVQVEDEYVRRVYADGSVNLSSCFMIESEGAAQISPQSVTRGKWTSGSNWWNMTGGKAYYNSGVVVCSFYFDASGSQGRSATIESVYEPYIRSIGWNVSDISLVKVNSHHARLGFVLNTSGGVLPASTTCYLHLYVNGNDNMYTEFDS
ncbi:hypothetical protein [Murdochiella massiliensis]|uniref:hypothetical protein n=1 Tax=Murdochiella massiliensis TaxID=1673723 RepID=UPI000832B035|nr:hypothetical protein [Murdochiella massiliensis]